MLPTSGSKRKEILQLRILNARSKVTGCTVSIGKKNIKKKITEEESKVAKEYVKLHPFSMNGVFN